MCRCSDSNLKKKCGKKRREPRHYARCFVPFLFLFYGEAEREKRKEENLLVKRGSVFYSRATLHTNTIYPLLFAFLPLSLRYGVRVFLSTALYTLISLSLTIALTLHPCLSDSLLPSCSLWHSQFSLLSLLVGVVPCVRCPQYERRERGDKEREREAPSSAVRCCFQESKNEK